MKGRNNPRYLAIVGSVLLGASCTNSQLNDPPETATINQAIAVGCPDDGSPIVQGPANEQKRNIYFNWRYSSAIGVACVKAANGEYLGLPNVSKISAEQIDSRGNISTNPRLGVHILRFTVIYPVGNIPEIKIGSAPDATSSNSIPINIQDGNATLDQ